jgi:hypothetical protein
MLRTGVGSLLLFLLFFAASCGSKDNNIYLDYKIWGEEGNDSITVMLQFRLKNAEGATVALKTPAKVELDGQPLKEDSSKMTGPFYEIMKSAQGFDGKHSIVYTNSKGKQYREDFIFRVITLKTPLPEAVMRGELVLELEGLNPEDYVRVLLTDTSFTGEEINRLDTVKNGRVIISKQDLRTVMNGPVYLELYREDEKRITNAMKPGGQLSITYGLKRAFRLKDQE